MTEAQVGLLYNIAAVIGKSKTEVNNTVLKSYYLMRCKDITRGYALPDKHFSSKTRCPNCCIEWRNNTEVKVHAIKLSKRQRKRIKTSKEITSDKKSDFSKKDLLNSNELVQICTFCKNSTITPVLKPHKQLTAKTDSNYSNITPQDDIKTNEVKSNLQTIKSKTKKVAVTNVYSNALDVFSLKNKNNILPSTIKEKPKVINNNKKKKDKYAGLCQKAVLASAKMKEQKVKLNTLNLFLKPSAT